MKKPLIPARKPHEFATRERCFITEILNDDAEPRVSLARCRVPPGVATELHSLSVDEWYLVETGAGAMEVGGEPAFPVKPGDTVVIAREVSQRIRNTGDTDLVFQCICTPRFTPDAYRALE